MDLINNRYRVLKNIKQSKLVSTYLVTDVKISSEPMQLNIINKEYVPDELLNYYIKEFKSLTTIDSVNIAKLYRFGAINFIDNKKVDNIQYYYINEKIEENLDFIKLVSNMNTDEILDLFIEICQSINYLHLRGFVYGELNTNNVYINNSKVNLKDIATIGLEKYDYWTQKDSQIIFRAPEILAGGTASAASDIYSLGVMLLFMCKREINENLRIANELAKLKNVKEIVSEDYKKFLNNIVNIIQKMTEQSISKRYESITEIIEDTNKVFNKSYKPHKQEELEKLNFKTKIVGRDYEITSVVNMYNSKEIKEKFVCFHGERGIGKTRLLKELEFLLTMKKANVYGSFTIEASNESRNKGFYEILRKLVAECDEDLLERYELDLVKLIPELAEKKKIALQESLQGEKEKLRIINSVCGFIGDFLKGKPTVFIIDNLHLASDLSIEILEHIYLRTKNIMIIFSYCDGELSNNKRLSELIGNLNNKENFIDTTLFGLSNEDTVLMIQDILRTAEKPSKFGEGVFSKTYGNPQFTEEAIKKLFSEKVIYIDEKNGTWDSKYYDYKRLPIPANMEQAVLSQINDLDNVSSEVLKVLSLFNTGIPTEDLVSMVNYSESEIIKSISTLESRGILIKKIEDRGFVFDFSNRILKNLVKTKLDKGYRKEKHKSAAKLLEKLYESGVENRTELIYHFEKAGEYNKAIKYCLENADNMEKLNSRDEAIKSILRAFSMLQSSESLAKLQLLVRLGNIYDEIGDAASAVKYLEEAQAIAEGLEDSRYHVDVLVKLANIYFKKNEIEKTLQYIKSCERLLYRADMLGKYPKGYLRCKEVQARVYLIKQDYDRVKEICIRGISLCGEEYFKLKGLFYKNLGNSYIETGKIEKALDCYEKSLSCFERRNYPEGIAIALNNLSVIYGDFYQDTEKGINYLLKMKEISEKNHIIIYELMALANLASYYYNDFSYELALDYLLEALEKSKKVEYESNVFYCYNYLSNVYLRLGNYKEAYDYYVLATKELEEYPEQGRDIVVYYQMAADLFYSFGDYEKAKTFIQMTLDIYENDEFMQKWESIILFQYIELYTKEKEEETAGNLEAIKNTMSNYTSPLKKLNTIYDAIIILKEKGFTKSAAQLYECLKTIDSNDKPSILKLKEVYVDGIFKNSSSGLKSLNNAVEMARILSDKAHHWKVCCALGEMYYSKRDYFYAVNYYFEACEVVKNIAVQMPESIAIKFINSPGVIKPFNVLMAMRRSESNNNSQLVVEDRDSLMRLFDFGQFEDILTNKHFIKSAHRIYNSYLPREFRSVRGIIKNLYSDPIRNLEIVSKYLASVTLATRSLIIIENYEQSYYTIASNDGSSQIPSSKFIFERVREVREPLLITEEELLTQGVKAVICIPVIMNNAAAFENNEHKVINSFSTNSIKGYIYMETDRILNNFNIEGLRNCTELSRLTGSILEKYQLMISSSIDKLTGMLTRKFLEDALSEHIDRADKFHRVFSIIMLDLDHFKHINDRFGHQTGDEVLRKTCYIIKNNLREDDICGRYGGEEFIIILPDTDCDEALKLAEKFRNAIDKAHILGDKTPVTVSMGIASYPQNAQWKQELVEKADQALYVAKELGRNRCEIWNSEFSNKNKTTNKLIGIVSGNTVEDSRKVLAMLDIIDLIKQDIKVEDKIFNLLGRMVEMTEAEYGMLFIVENGQLTQKYSRKIFEEHWVTFPNYNSDIISSVINKKQGVYLTDWDETASFDSITGRPDWHSISVTPIIKNGEVKGVLYLTVSTKKKEFKFEEFNFINTIGELAVGIL